ncbi:hypothetical protein ABXJ76_08855 [Methylobacter sp. G7]|uniref:hypothetical protein n=1 Tax=Methylobacter sp. G7 TaxID=3230117 RepID=UPI003D809753
MEHKPAGIDNLIIDRPREVLTAFGMSLAKDQKVTGSARTISNIYQIELFTPLIPLYLPTGDAECTNVSFFACSSAC